VVPAVGAGIALSVAGIGTATPAGAVDIPVWHWNKKGGCSGISEPPTRDDGNCGGLEASNFLLNAVTYANPRPWHITLNEVCRPQMQSLEYYLASIGYSPYWIPTNVSASVDSRCGQHGMAIFTLGTKIDSSYRLLTQSNPAEGDRRKVFCVSSTSFIGPRKACTSHITNKSSPGNIRTTQDIEIAQFATTWRSSDPTVVGLDRNLTDRPNHWGGGYKEIDNANNGLGRGTYEAWSPATSRAKLDWVWGSFNGNGAHGGLTVACELGGMSSTAGRYLSDHCFMAGAFRN
jgi:hypothetical protein